MPNPEVSFLLEGQNKINALLAALGQVLGLTVVVGAVTDDDTAATTGTALFVVNDDDGFVHLESALDGAADTTFELYDGGPVFDVVYAASPAGAQLYYDEDAATPAEQLRADLEDATPITDEAHVVGELVADKVFLDETVDASSEPVVTGVAHVSYTVVAVAPAAGEVQFVAPNELRFHADDADDPIEVDYVPWGGTETLLLVAADGRTLEVTHDATPDDEGVELYIDDDATNEFEKILFVSPTNADGALTTAGGSMALPLNTALMKTPTIDVRFDQQADGSIVMVTV